MGNTSLRILQSHEGYYSDIPRLHLRRSTDVKDAGTKSLIFMPTGALPFVTIRPLLM